MGEGRGEGFTRIALASLRDAESYKLLPEVSASAFAKASADKSLRPPATIWQPSGLKNLYTSSDFASAGKGFAASPNALARISGSGAAVNRLTIGITSIGMHIAMAPAIGMWGLPQSRNRPTAVPRPVIMAAYAPAR